MLTLAPKGGWHGPEQHAKKLKADGKCCLEVNCKKSPDPVCANRHTLQSASN